MRSRFTGRISLLFCAVLLCTAHIVDAGALVVAWIYKTVAGIASDEARPGFRRIVLAPGWTAAREYGAGSHRIVTQANAKPQIDSRG